MCACDVALVCVCMSVCACAFVHVQADHYLHVSGVFWANSQVEEEVESEQQAAHRQLLDDMVQELAKVCVEFGKKTTPRLHHCSSAAALCTVPCRLHPATHMPVPSQASPGWCQNQLDRCCLHPATPCHALLCPALAPTLSACSARALATCRGEPLTCPATLPSNATWRAPTSPTGRCCSSPTVTQTRAWCSEWDWVAPATSCCYAAPKTEKQLLAQMSSS